MKLRKIKRFVVIIAFFSVLAFSFKPVSVVNDQPFLLPSTKVDSVEDVRLLENRPTEYPYKNANFGRLYLMEDEFSDKNGIRPHPWGAEVFNGNPQFLSDETVFESGGASFKIKGHSLEDIGVLAIPGYIHKPRVSGEKLYYLSFRIMYDFKEGKGIRLLQQFFLEDQFWNPDYAVLGPYITGSSNGKWEQVGLLAKAPPGTARGDPAILLHGIGELYVDSVYFGEAVIGDQKRGASK